MRQELDCDVALQLRVARAVHLAHAARAEQRLHLIHTEPPALDHQLCGVRSAVAPDHRGRLEKALRALVRRQERLHFLAQRLVAGAGRGEVGLTLSAGSARAPANTSFTRAQSSGARVTCGGFYSASVTSAVSLCAVRQRVRIDATYVTHAMVGSPGKRAHAMTLCSQENRRPSSFSLRF